MKKEKIQTGRMLPESFEYYDLDWHCSPEWHEIIMKSTPIEISIQEIAGVKAYSTDNTSGAWDNEWHDYCPVIVREIQDRNYRYEVLEGADRVWDLSRDGWSTVYAIVTDGKDKKGVSFKSLAFRWRSNVHENHSCYFSRFGYHRDNWSSISLDHR